ncbi:hypothetical protein [Bernardetia sp. MNP-M8]|uniref:hypothetical protein n=1 Tax=Bernardetia sp. MNP-M8 TaxID=3127470 RepID=UPI0030D3CE69
MENKELFSLNKKSFKNDFLPIYKQFGINPNKVFQTSFTLPFHLPFNGGTSVTMFVEDKIAFTATFNTLSSKNGYRAGVVSTEELVFENYKTIVELSLVFEQDAYDKKCMEDGEDLISNLFDICLERLNLFIRSYRIMTKDKLTHQVNLKMLEAIPLFRIVDTETWIEQMGACITHTNVQYEKKPLTNLDSDKVFHYANVIGNNLNPFILSQELILDAQRNYVEGFYKEAIINIQTSFEVFLRTLLTELYKAENKTSEEADEIYDAKGFIGVLKSQFHERLGGQWKIKDEDCKIGRWYSKCYKIRNSIIHGGLVPDYIQTEEAINATDEVVLEIFQLLKTKESTYPNISSFISVANM